VAALLTFALEPQVVSGTTPAIARLTIDGRANVYDQITIVSTALLGFMLTAITILVSLDGGRKIVKELHYGEAFKLLIVNMLATVLLLLVLTSMGIAGSSLDAGSSPDKTFESFYEWIGVASLFELGLSLFYFSITMYKVAAY
jgi:hypothetical protein